MKSIAFAALLGIAIAVTGCKKHKTPSSTSVEGGVLPSAGAAGSKLKRPSTTSAGIALSNLTADIEFRTKNDHGVPAERLTLVEMLLSRAQYLARIADLDQADVLATDTVARAPKTWEAHATRAIASESIHKWDDALRELAAAEKLGAPADRVASTKEAIYLATGRYDDVVKARGPGYEPYGSLAMATWAVLASRMNKPDESDRLFEQARAAFRDVSPFAFAWMDFQRAQTLDAKGDVVRAQAYYAEACEIMPTYAHAAIHLASAESPEKARDRLEKLRDTSDDPDLLAALSDAAKRANDTKDAQRLAEEARARYEAVLEKHPEAFADHAARFFLASDPKRAVALAAANARSRPTEEAFDLWMAAGAAADDDDAMCASSRGTTKLPYATTRARDLARAGLSRCHD